MTLGLVATNGVGDSKFRTLSKKAKAKSFIPLPHVYLIPPTGDPLRPDRPSRTSLRIHSGKLPDASLHLQTAVDADFAPVF